LKELLPRDELLLYELLLYDEFDPDDGLRRDERFELLLLL